MNLSSKNNDSYSRSNFKDTDRVQPKNHRDQGTSFKNDTGEDLEKIKQAANPFLRVLEDVREKNRTEKFGQAPAPTFSSQNFGIGKKEVTDDPEILKKQPENLVSKVQPIAEDSTKAKTEDSKKLADLQVALEASQLEREK